MSDDWRKQLSPEAQEMLRSPEFDQASADLEVVVDDLVISFAQARSEFRHGLIDGAGLESRSHALVDQIAAMGPEAAQTLLLEAIGRLAVLGPMIALSTRNEYANELRAAAQASLQGGQD